MNRTSDFDHTVLVTSREWDLFWVKINHHFSRTSEAVPCGNSISTISDVLDSMVVTIQQTIFPY